MKLLTQKNNKSETYRPKLKDLKRNSLIYFGY